ncbi:peptidoglycan DD-metalloendopeptidase family protein [Anaerocolumna sedimenticola]|uniref:Peptidoglycan DD-metalloendopeptidase family protein n=2 Tax=Anaerocolumna sedimenticola TaxID=2696063 RepID=A0A6P1TW97_9FIRM|nr:peptidoglycan DD-metalloendopeptidase family protein [Anaerocolumna sedimenticola]
MLIPSKMIKDIKRKMDKELESNEINTKKGSQTYDTADYITLAMLLNRYNLNNARNIGKSNSNFLISNLSQNKSFMELKAYYKAILGDIKCFPVIPNSDGELNVTFIDTWNAYRSYGGNRRHEGTDIMSKENLRGVYPIVSMTDGTVEKMGWLEQGGYRIGVRGTYGAYYYYAHLESYAPDLKIGDSINAGDFLGYMGDSGYGAEGTVGEFDVHLHVGIYVETDFGELSVNPYSILLYLESIKGSKEK